MYIVYLKMKIALQLFTLRLISRRFTEITKLIYFLLIDFFLFDARFGLLTYQFFLYVTFDAKGNLFVNYGWTESPRTVIVVRSNLLCTNYKISC